MTKTEATKLASMLVSRRLADESTEKSRDTAQLPYAIDRLSGSTFGSRSIESGTALGISLAENSSPIKRVFLHNNYQRCIWHYHPDVSQEAADLVTINVGADVSAAFATLSCKHHFAGDPSQILSSGSANRHLGGVELIDFRFDPKAKLQNGKASLAAWALDHVDTRVARAESADAWISTIERLLEVDSDVAPAVLQWLQTDQRQPRTVWYCIWLLQAHGAAGLDDFVLDVLRRAAVSEATVGAVIAIRQCSLQAPRRAEAATMIFRMLATFRSVKNVSEGSVEETLLSELLDAGSVLGDNASVKAIAHFWQRQWSFKIRLRALVATQSLLVRCGESVLTDAQMWDDLVNEVRSMVGSYNISSTSRALIHRAIDVFVARLGPESKKALEIVEQAPELKRRIERAFDRARDASQAVVKGRTLPTTSAGSSALVSSS